MHHIDNHTVRTLIQLTQTSEDPADHIADLVDLFYPVVQRWNIDDDQRQNAMEALIVAAHTMAIVDDCVSYLKKVAWQATTRRAKESVGVAVPAMTRSRYRRTVDRYGSEEEALKAVMAGEVEDMSLTTFVAVMRALHGVLEMKEYGSSVTTEETDEHEQTLNRILVHGHLLPLLSYDAGVVVRLFYGFPELDTSTLAALEEHGIQPGTPLPDVTVGEVLGGCSQSWVNRRRQKALTTMREALTDTTALREEASTYI